MLKSRIMKAGRTLAAIALATVLLTAQNAKEVEITAEPLHHLTLQNAYVRAFKVEVGPHAQTLMHWHRHDYIFVTLGDSQVESDVRGKPSVSLKLQDGETRFTPGNFAHIAKNLADAPFRNVTIELMQDEKAHQSPPPKWDEDRGVHVLNAGTQDIMFVKDGVRVSDIQLQPGGVIPKHHHSTPHLTVAVTDLELKADNADGKPSQIVQAKAGDVRWTEAGPTHTITNVGKSRARYITLEFPTNP